MASIIDAFVSSLKTALSDAGITDAVLNTLSVNDLFRLAANTEIVGGGGAGTDDQTAAEVSIADVGELFTAVNVEAALAEVKALADAVQTADGVAVTDAAENFVGTNVEAILAELQDNLETSVIVLESFVGDQDTAHAGSTDPHAAHPRIFIGNGLGTYTLGEDGDYRLYTSLDDTEAAPVNTGRPLGDWFARVVAP